MKDLLYHGSNILITDKKLKPHISFDYKPLIYATDDYAYAILRCGKFDPFSTMIKEDYTGKNNKITLVELKEREFERVFNTKGYIYRVPREKFFKRDSEYISEVIVPFERYLIILNVWELMQTNTSHYNLIKFCDSDKYFKENGIDKNAYLLRRKKRLEELSRVLGLS